LRAARIATDDHAHRLALGEFDIAVYAGLVPRYADISLASIPAGDRTLSRLPTDMTIADLMGVAAHRRGN
jgi:hypothetical protein